MDEEEIQETSAASGGATSIHITALDGIVNVNSLFTFAVFVGLAWSPSSDGAALSVSECAAGDSVEEDLVSFHVFAFASFLFSSLVALCLKQAIRVVLPRRAALVFARRHARVNKTILRGGLIASAAGSVSGCTFLMLALFNVVQIKLGRLGCSGAAAGAVVPLVVLIPTGLLIYAAIVVYAFTR